MFSSKLTPRERREEIEKLILSPQACLARNSLGREINEEACSIRTCFQRDTDRIVHCKSFRRLKHKTQVFLNPEGDHYRTRMTHTLEVSRIARTISRALSLNEDLTEAIALGHDLGHTAFGHAGERALNEIHKEGFRHNEQSLRVVQRLEKNGGGLNLSREVLDGIACHTGSVRAFTLEGRVVALSDRIAYVNHDTDDAVRAGIMSEDDIPEGVRAVLGGTYSERINTVIRDAVEASKDDIVLSEGVAEAMKEFRAFMFKAVYENPRAKAEESKVKGILERLYAYYLADISHLPEDYLAEAEISGAERAVCDYIAGMTDQYAVSKYCELFIPSGWNVK
jgi:dGTPase